MWFERGGVGQPYQLLHGGRACGQRFVDWFIAQNILPGSAAEKRN
jgi:hypothetical protein